MLKQYTNLSHIVYTIGDVCLPLLTRVARIRNAKEEEKKTIRIRESIQQKNKTKKEGQIRKMGIAVISWASLSFFSIFFYPANRVQETQHGRNHYWHHHRTGVLFVISRCSAAWKPNEASLLHISKHGRTRWMQLLIAESCLIHIWNAMVQHFENVLEDCSLFSPRYSISSSIHAEKTRAVVVECHRSSVSIVHPQTVS